MQNSENCDQNNFDDRKKKFDMNAIHFQKTMTEISKLRSGSLLFDIVIKTGDKSFQVSNNNNDIDGNAGSFV
jgi:hypothetical protein